MPTDAAAQPTGHPLNRHLFIVDNYYLLKSMDTASVDLICTDPPFAKNETFVGSLKPPLTEEEIRREWDTLKSWGINNAADAEQANVVWPTGETTAKFKDIWSWETDVHEQWMDDISDQHSKVYNAIEAARHTHSEGTAAYLAYMAIRLIECRRVLKPTGALYLHCDHTANGYLRMLLDAIVGRDNFRNEIIWAYSGGGIPRSDYPRKHDTIFRYVKERGWTFNVERKPYKENTQQVGKHSTYSGGHDIDLDRGTPVTDWWTDIKTVTGWSPERTGYPTQKPVALAERIIKASSNPGDTVFDPFAGCAYVPVAAERLGRQWIACDISPRALTVLRRQFEKFAYSVDGEITKGELLSVADVSLRGPRQLPRRMESEDEAEPVKALPSRKYKTRASIFAREEMLEFLLGLSGWRAWCCGFANWKVSSYGRPVIERTTRNFELDHIDPQSKRGRHEIDNRAPLCPYHNNKKSDRRIHLDELREEIIKAGELAVASVDDLVDLPWAHDQALEHGSSEKARRVGPTLPGIG